MALHFIPIADPHVLPGQRESRTRFDWHRAQMTRAWLDELPHLTAEERAQDIADTTRCLGVLNEIEGGRS